MAVKMVQTVSAGNKTDQRIQVDLTEAIQVRISYQVGLPALLTLKRSGVPDTRRASPVDRRPGPVLIDPRMSGSRPRWPAVPRLPWRSPSSWRRQPAAATAEALAVTRLRAPFRSTKP